VVCTEKGPTEKGSDDVRNDEELIEKRVWGRVDDRS